MLVIPRTERLAQREQVFLHAGHHHCMLVIPRTERLAQSEQVKKNQKVYILCNLYITKASRVPHVFGLKCLMNYEGKVIHLTDLYVAPGYEVSVLISAQRTSAQ
jgi:hypothetical protein